MLRQRLMVMGWALMVGFALVSSCQADGGGEATGTDSTGALSTGAGTTGFDASGAISTGVSEETMAKEIFAKEDREERDARKKAEVENAVKKQEAEDWAHRGFIFFISDLPFPEKIRISYGQSIEIRGQEVGGTGFGWYLEGIDKIPDILEISGGERVVPNRGKNPEAVYHAGGVASQADLRYYEEPGFSGGVEERRFVIKVKPVAGPAVGTKIITLRFVYKRIWMAEDSKVREVTLHIVPPEKPRNGL